MKKELFILLFFIISLPLFAQNHMELMKMLEGPSNCPSYPYFGYTVAALDFNGDGYDDLVVGAPYYRTQAHFSFGKLYLYFGNSTGLPDNPDFTLTGFISLNYFEQNFGFHIANLGDMNGDGYEDLGYFTSSYNNNYEENPPVYHAKILLGNAVQDSIADYDFAFPGNVYIHDFTEFINLQPLGDINGDGYDDAGFTVATKTHAYHNETLYYYIVFGNPDNMELTPFKKQQGGDRDYYNTIHGIGDINNDGYDDFEIGYLTDAGTTNHHSHNMIYFGNTVIDTIPEYEYMQDNAFGFTGISCGDFNGDGIDDFIKCFAYPSTICLGNNNGDIIPYINISFDTGEGPNIKEYSYGDINGDGKEDIVWSNPYYGMDNGRARLFLGGDNGECDLTFDAQDTYKNFGWANAIGDFNGDGYGDVAIGAPNYNDNEWSEGENGRVWVYAGNPDLYDTTESNNDEISQVNKINFKAYPNPFNPIATFSFENKKGDLKYVDIEIYNLKGQKLVTLKVNNLKSGVNKVIWNAKNYSSGVYISKLKANGNVLSNKKITLLK